jgi:integrase
MVAMHTRKRASYQRGSVVLKPRASGPDVWVFRYMDNGVQKSEPLGTVDKFKTKAAARKHADKLLAEINERISGVKVSGLCSKFLKEGMTEIRPRSQTTYTSFVKRIRMEFADWRVDDLAKDVLTVEAWINNYQRAATKNTPARPASKKTKLHLKAFIHRLFECAMKWKLLPMQRNPMGLIEVKGRRKRVRTLTLLTGKQFRDLIADKELCEHVRVMIQVAMCLGLRISEILGLRWEDVDFRREVIIVKRSSVGQYVDDTKTDDSEAEVPMHGDLAALLAKWKKNKDSPPVDGWIFGNAVTKRPYWGGTLQQDHLVPAGKKIGVASLGWHDFRHTYRAMMGELEVPLEMQKTLMRHSDISTTLSYGRKAVTKKSRDFNAQVVEKLRRIA